MNLFMIFGLLPGLGAAGAAGVLRPAPLAGAAASFFWALLFLAPMLRTQSWTLFVWPVVFGAALGATIAGLMLWRWPDGSVWNRMSVAFLVSTAAGIALLFYGLGGS